MWNFYLRSHGIGITKEKSFAQIQYHKSFIQRALKIKALKIHKRKCFPNISNNSLITEIYYSTQQFNHKHHRKI